MQLTIIPVAVLLSYGMGSLALSGAEAIPSTPNVDAAIRAVKDILAPGRRLDVIDRVPHSYGDMFELSSYIMEMGVSSLIFPLHAIGLTLPVLKELTDSEAPFNIVARTQTSDVLLERRELYDSTVGVIQTLYEANASFKLPPNGTSPYVRFFYNMTALLTVDVTNPLNATDTRRIFDSASVVTVARMYSSSYTTAPTIATLLHSPLRTVARHLPTMALPLCHKPADIAAAAAANDGADGAARCVPLDALAVVPPSLGPVAHPYRNAVADAYVDALTRVRTFASIVHSAAANILSACNLPLPVPLDVTFATAPLADAACSPSSGPTADADCAATGAAGGTDAPPVTLRPSDRAVLRARLALLAMAARDAYVHTVAAQPLVAQATDAPLQMVNTRALAAGVPFPDAAAAAVHAMSSASAAVTASLSSLREVEYALMRDVAARVGRAVRGSDVADYVATVGAKEMAPRAKPTPLAVTVRGSAGANDDNAAATAEGGAAVDAAGAMAVDAVAEAVDRGAEGAVMLTAGAADGTARVVHTVQRPVARGDGWKVILPNGGTVVLNVTSSLHGFVLPHVGSGLAADAPSLTVTAAAKRLGGVVVLVGHVASAPQTITLDSAVALRDGATVDIALKCALIPAARAFERALIGLSPEMTAFARAFRALQLQKGMLAVAVVPVRPQLEAIMALPRGALGKDIALLDEVLSLARVGVAPASLAGGIVVSGGGTDLTVVNATSKVWASVAEARGVLDTWAAAAAAERARIEAELAEWREAKRLADLRMPPPRAVPVPSPVEYWARAPVGGVFAPGGVANGALNEAFGGGGGGGGGSAGGSAGGNAVDSDDGRPSGAPPPPPAPSPAPASAAPVEPPQSVDGDTPPVAQPAAPPTQPPAAQAATVAHPSRVAGLGAALDAALLAHDTKEAIMPMTMDVGTAVVTLPTRPRGTAPPPQSPPPPPPQSPPPRTYYDPAVPLGGGWSSPGGGSFAGRDATTADAAGRRGVDAQTADWIPPEEFDVIVSAGGVGRGGAPPPPPPQVRYVVDTVVVSDALTLLDALTVAGDVAIAQASLHFIAGAVHHIAGGVIRAVVEGDTNVLADAVASHALMAAVVNEDDLAGVAVAAVPSSP